MAETQDQEALDIEAVATQLKNVATQQGTVLSGIQALEQALASAGSTTPAVDQALADLKTAAQGAADASQAAANALPTPPTPTAKK